MAQGPGGSGFSCQVDSQGLGVKGFAVVRFDTLVASGPPYAGG